MTLQRGNRRNEDVTVEKEGDVYVLRPIAATRHCTVCKKDVSTEKFGWYAQKRKDGLKVRKMKGRCNPCGSEEMKKRYRATPEALVNHRQKARIHNIKKTYGLSYEQYCEMLTSRNGICDLCGKVSEKKLNVDHCHRTGRVRGMLCLFCNMALSKFHDSPDYLIKAVGYLTKNMPWTVVPVKSLDQSVLSYYASECEYV